MTNEQLSCLIEHIYRRTQNALICLNNHGNLPDVEGARTIISNLTDDLLRNMARLRG